MWKHFTLKSKMMDADNLRLKTLFDRLEIVIQ